MNNPKEKRTDTTKQVTMYRIKEHQDITKVEFPDYVRVVIDDDVIPTKALFFLRAENQTVNWYKLFETIKPNLQAFEDCPPKVKYSGFIYIVNIKKSTYACTGGLGFHTLTKKYNIEPRFGIMIAKKILLPEQLRGLVQKDSSGIINSLDRVFKGNYNPIGDIDNLHRVLTTIRASAPKNEKLIKDNDIIIGSNIKAGDSLNVTGQKDINELNKFISQVDSIWNRKNLNTLEIPELEYINPKHNGSLIETLNSTLRVKIIRKDQLSDLFIDDMEIGLLPDRITQYKLKIGRIHRELSTQEDLFQELSVQLVNNDFDNIGISFEFEDGIDNLPNKNVRHYICGDIEYGNQTYFVISDRWYKANNKFIDKINEGINEIRFLDTDESSLPVWDKVNCKDENDYIYDFCYKVFTILHRHLIHPVGDKDKIELCDLLSKSKTNDDVYWFHIKHSKGAALRELFSQGYVSAQLYKDNISFKYKTIQADMDSNKRHSLSQDDKDKLAALSTTHLRQIHIVYTIYDDSPNSIVKIKNDMKTLDYFDKTLTLYAKIDLLRRVQDLRGMGFNVALARIKPYGKLSK